MMKTIAKKIKKAIQNLTWKNISRIFYCTLISLVVYFGFNSPEIIPPILDAITKALLIIIQ